MSAKEMLDYLRNKNSYINDETILTFDEAKLLLDYITNLEQKVELYENPDDMTLFYMWLDEKAKDKMKELQEELKSANESITWWTNRFNALQEENEILINILFDIKKYLLERLNEYKNCINKENITHLSFKLLILKLLDKIDKVKIIEEKENKYE